MGSKKHLTPAKRNQIIGAHNNRVPLRNIAVNEGVCYATVKNTVRLATARNPEQKDLPRSGPPRHSSEDQDNRLISAP